MARPRKNGVQLDKSKGRHFCRIDYSTQKQRKVYLTTHERQSARWYKALAPLVSDDPENGPSNHDEAIRRVAMLEGARTAAEERRVIERFTTVPMKVPTMTFREAADQLSSILELIGKHTELTEQMIEDWWLALDSETCDKLLIEWGYPRDEIRSLKKFNKLDWRPNPEYFKRYPTHRKRVWERYCRDKGIPTDILAPDLTDQEPASKQTVKACFPEWERQKLDSGNPPSKTHIGEIKSTMRHFLKVIGNKPISMLTKQDFLEWKRHLLKRQKEEDWSAITFNKQMGNVRSVIRYLRKETDWPFPEGITERVEFSKQAYKSGVRNRERMPVETFKTLLAKAGEWASIDVEEYADSLLVSDGPNARLERMNNLKQANRVLRRGMLLRPILHLAANCGFDPACIAKLTVDDLKGLDGDLPYVELGRSKVAAKAGADVMRLTPFLPSTVESIKRWMECARPTDSLFLNDAGRPLTSSIVSKSYKALAEAAEVNDGFTMKHLRNVGPSLGKRADVSEDKRNVFLGHLANGGTNVFYEDPDLGPEYLLDIVNLIGNEYFDGEQVRKSK